MYNKKKLQSFCLLFTQVVLECVDYFHDFVFMLDTPKVMLGFVSLSLFNTYIKIRIQQNANEAEAAEIDN